MKKMHCKNVLIFAGLLDARCMGVQGMQRRPLGSSFPYTLRDRVFTLARVPVLLLLALFAFGVAACTY